MVQTFLSVEKFSCPLSNRIPMLLLYITIITIMAPVDLSRPGNENPGVLKPNSQFYSGFLSPRGLLCVVGHKTLIVLRSTIQAHNTHKPQNTNSLLPSSMSLLVLSMNRLFAEGVSALRSEATMKTNADDMMISPTPIDPRRVVVVNEVPRSSWALDRCTIGVLRNVFEGRDLSLDDSQSSSSTSSSASYKKAAIDEVHSSSTASSG